MPSFHPRYCPACQGNLQYVIALDEYVCRKCDKHFDVLAIEREHKQHDSDTEADDPNAT